MSDSYIRIAQAVVHLKVEQNLRGCCRLGSAAKPKVVLGSSARFSHRQCKQIVLQYADTADSGIAGKLSLPLSR